MWRRFVLTTMAVGLLIGGGAVSSYAAAPGSVASASQTVTANDKVDGVGAERLNERIIAAQKKPLKATGEPIVIAQRTTVGGNYPFQDTADAATAMIDYYNNKLGGVGADYKAGKPGRPIQLEVCTAELAAAPSQACANELVAKDPVLLLDQLNLLQSVEYPIYQSAGVPVVENTAITPSATTNPNIVVIDGGCFTSGGIPIVHTMKDMKYKKVAFISASNLPSSQACTKVLQQIPPEQYPNTEFKVFPYNTSDPDQLAVAQQVVSFDPDAVIMQTSGTACSQFWSAWDQLGYKGKIYNAASCQNPDLFKSASTLLPGQIFNFKADNPDTPASYYKDHPFAKTELEMTDKALEAAFPDEDFSTLARANGAAALWVANVLDQMALKGEKIDTTTVLPALTADTYHVPNQPAPDCSKDVPGYTSMCSWKNSLWQVKSVKPDGTATWKLVSGDIDISNQFRKLSGDSGSTTTTAATK